MQTPTRHFLLVGLTSPVRDKLRAALGIRGNRFYKTDSQSEALGLVGQLEPSIVFCASKFARGDGYDLCLAVKDGKGLSHVGVILFEENDAPYDASRAVLAGVDQFFTRRTSEDRISELTMAVVERVEMEKPLSERRSTPKQDTPQPAKPTPADTADSAPDDDVIYHGFQRPASDAGTGDSGEAGEPTGQLVDPLRDFFGDEQAPPPKFAPLFDPPPEPNAEPMGGPFELLSAEASDEITRHVESWVEMHYGQKVDESIRQEVRRALQPMARRIILASLQKAEKDRE